MRARAALILITLLAVAGRAIPCEAMGMAAPAPGAPAHECCDPSACPDQPAPDHKSAPDSRNNDCCVISDARQHQQDSRLLTDSVSIAPPEPAAGPATLTATADEPIADPSPPAARSSPLHLLFAVFLV
jgi:hypothetical protein